MKYFQIIFEIKTKEGIKIARATFLTCPSKILFIFGIIYLQPQLRVVSVLKERNPLLRIGVCGQTGE